MKRLNIVPVEVLSSKDLMAEYCELPHIATYVNKHGVAGDLPETYRMGVGHVKFFTNKLSWLYNRHLSLYTELRCRGYSLNRDAHTEVCLHMQEVQTATEEQQVYWEPTPPDYYTNMKYLGERGYA